MDKIEQINKELAGRVMPDIEYIALLNTKVIILQALADKRLELLKRLIIDLSWCPICGTTLIHEVTYERFPHTDDCELAEAIAEE